MFVTQQFYCDCIENFFDFLPAEHVAKLFAILAFPSNALMHNYTEEL